MAKKRLQKPKSDGSSSEAIKETSLISIKKMVLYKCNHCNYTSTKQCLLTRHQLVHSRDKPYSCGECDARFTQSGSLRRHFLKAHTNEEVLDFSDAKHVVKSELSTYPVIRLIGKTDPCTQSSDLAMDQSVLKLKKSYICSECDARFTQSGSLKRHRLRAHARVKGFKCHNCPYEGATKDDLHSHMLIHGEEKPFQCTECKAAFKVPSRLRKHQSRAHRENKRLKCPSCDYTCSFPSTLKTHQLVHTKRKTYKCADCGKWFLRLSHLNRHQLTAHSECFVVCDYCSYSCSIKEQLQAHVKFNHMGVKSFKCSKCKAAFITGYHLKRHNVIVHNKEKRFKCSVCSYECYYKSELEKHKFIHSGFKSNFTDVLTQLIQTPEIKDEELFKCSVCQKTFDCKLNLDFHLSKHKGDTPFRFSICGSSFSVQTSLKDIDNLHPDVVI